MSDPARERLELAKVISTVVIAVVLIVGMTWIVLSPYSDETNKAALIVLSSAVGYIFGRETR
jgi:hypothetical protein